MWKYLLDTGALDSGWKNRYWIHVNCRDKTSYSYKTLVDFGPKYLVLTTKDSPTVRLVIPWREIVSWQIQEITQ